MSDQFSQGDRQKAGDLGWGPGAEKSGNADGAKDPTAVNRRKDKHPLHAEVGQRWQET
jgi:hypothetical protein